MPQFFDIDDTLPAPADVSTHPTESEPPTSQTAKEVS
jgi:hypothetical protein